MLAKLENGRIKYAPSVVTIDNRVVANPLDEQLISLGYKELEVQDQPAYQEGFYASPVYTEEENKIIQGWEMIEYEPPVDPMEEFAQILRGEK